ncbi:MAG: MmcQ/YjbR family DNA-binding protein [Pseudomonadota bacterium]
MDVKAVEDYCLSLPGAHLVVQWADSRVYKIDAKMFAVMSPGFDRIVLKCADQDMANMLVEAGIGHWAKYFGQKQWVAFALDMPTIEQDEMEARLRASYSIVRNSLTKKVQASLPAFEPN